MSLSLLGRKLTRVYGAINPWRSLSTAGNYPPIVPVVAPTEQLPVSFKSNQSPAERWEAVHKLNAKRLSLLTTPGVYSGRTVNVKDGKVASALTNLDQILQENRVRAIQRGQARHKKRGVLLREKHAQHWRKMFAHEIRQKIQLVHHIRSRGA